MGRQRAEEEIKKKEELLLAERRERERLAAQVLDYEFVTRLLVDS